MPIVILNRVLIFDDFILLHGKLAVLFENVLYILLKDLPPYCEVFFVLVLALLLKVVFEVLDYCFGFVSFLLKNKAELVRKWEP